jgi:hypothetical protein
MEVTGHPHTAAALFQVERGPSVSAQEIGETIQPVWLFCRREKSLPLPWPKPQITQEASYSLYH